MKKHITKSFQQTRKLGEIFAKEVLRLPPQKQAVILGLKGNLGGGKTTFLQGFARGLGIKEKILSPTFVILKRFKITNAKFKDFYHIDCYRLKSEKDILGLAFRRIISNPKNIIAIEWSERVKRALPQNTIFIKFIYPERSREVDENKREIIFKI
jgi:tRNA threonylcarbamoyladenosine biosynthesis protein TsaE